VLRLAATVRFGRDAHMKKALFGLLLAVAAWGVASSGPAQLPGAGAVAGIVAVHKTRVKTTGNKSFKDVVVYLEPLSADVAPPPAAHAVMDQRGLVFIPHVLAVQKGTTVDFLNSDNDRHNVYFLHDDTGQTLDIGTWGPGQTVSHTFDRTGLVITLCQLHLEMAAHIVVLEAPYFTLAEIDGESQSARYAIAGVPPGDYTLNVWHKKLLMKDGAVRVSLSAGETKNLNIALSK